MLASGVLAVQAPLRPATDRAAWEFRKILSRPLEHRIIPLLVGTDLHLSSQTESAMTARTGPG